MSHVRLKNGPNVSRPRCRLGSHRPTDRRDIDQALGSGASKAQGSGTFMTLGSDEALGPGSGVDEELGSSEDEAHWREPRFLL